MRAVCFQHDINMPACRVSTHQYSSSFLKNLVMCGTVPETLTLFQTKICDFPYPISDLIKNLIPYFSPGARRMTGALDEVLRHIHSSWRKH